jgi:hypothetical protein
MKPAIEIPKIMTLTEEQIKLMDILEEVYNTVKRDDRMFMLAVRISKQAMNKAEAETILYGLKIYLAQKLNPFNADLLIPDAVEIKCSICDNYATMMINNEFFKDVCSKCAAKMQGEFFHITPKITSSCKH